MGTGDRFTTLFGTSETDTYTQDERLAFLQGYHDALEMYDPEGPLSVVPKSHKAPPGLEQPYRAGEIKAQSDLERKKALDPTIIAAMINAI